MFNSTVLEVAIGLVFCYASVALIASSVYEAIASWLNLRSKTLFTGIARLLNATGSQTSGKDLLQKIYNDALVHPSGDGKTTHFDKDKCIPAYIPSKNFALALMHAIQQAPGKFENLSADINAVKDEQLRNLLLSLERKAAGNLDAFQHEVADWFDASMGRVSGIYKKWSQLWCFLIALVIAIIFNIDSVHLFKTLWVHPSLMAQVNFDKVDPALAAKAYQQLQMLPVGWNQAFEWSALLSPSLWLGWLLTASASLFGAPFWFDTLKTLVRLRGTGLKPDSEKATRDAAVK
jgi:hypothetical protein